MKSPITVYVTHTDPLLVAGIVATFSQNEEILVLQPPISRECLRHAKIVVADYRNGLALHQLTKTDFGGHGPAVLIISYARGGSKVRAALEAGVHGYILQDCTPQELIHSVRQLARGLRYVAPAVAAEMVTSLSQSTLTTRELDTLHLLAQGYSNKTIATRLNIALNTAKVHVKALMLKLDSTTRTQAVVTAIHRGLITENSSS
ncbi:response regulator transcription factor [Duganella alba]|nr:response regulator transcription factor [Duganella alba]